MRLQERLVAQTLRPLRPGIGPFPRRHVAEAIVGIDRRLVGTKLVRPFGGGTDFGEGMRGIEIRDWRLGRDQGRCGQRGNQDRADCIQGLQLHRSIPG
jgi:hypothetical protein